MYILSDRAEGGKANPVGPLRCVCCSRERIWSAVRYRGVSTRGKTAFMAKHKDLGACGSLVCWKAIVREYKNLYVLDLF